MVGLCECVLVIEDLDSGMWKTDFFCYAVRSLCPHSSYLCDVTLKSEDGKEFPCHKGVLCARLGEIVLCMHAHLPLQHYRWF